MSTNNSPLTFLCVSCEFKGVDFIRYCKNEGNKVYLVTSKNLEDKDWPRDMLDDIFYVEASELCVWNMKDVIAGLAHFMRSNPVDRIVALDDFDVEKAALLREHFRIPGMGQTTQRYFRDKLAMRMKAQEAGIAVPPFSPLFNDEQVNEYARTVSPPWVVKPRAEASTVGIRKVHSAEELWNVLHELGEDRHQYLVEQFKPGDVYHADALSFNGKLVFCRVSRYLNTPFEVAQGGGIFRSQTVEFGSADDKAIQKMNAQVMKAFGMQFSASHTEYIRSKEDGQFYFLETASRVGGANLAEMVEASSGINLWGEWARLETAQAREGAYKPPKARKDHAGIIVSLSRFQHPDSSAFNDPEVCWRMQKDYHIGLILQSKSTERIKTLLDDYAERVFRDFHASIS
ncbi:MAG: ATP-grasp domain-containing protein [Bacteroidota bacterium]